MLHTYTSLFTQGANPLETAELRRHDRLSNQVVVLLAALDAVQVRVTDRRNRDVAGRVVGRVVVSWGAGWVVVGRGAGWVVLLVAGRVGRLSRQDG